MEISGDKFGCSLNLLYLCAEIKAKTVKMEQLLHYCWKHKMWPLN